VCQQCGKAFFTLSNVRRHTRTHNEDKPCVCEQCGKVFLSLSDLKSHEQTHTEQKPYVLV
jgi:KRAB domain-containing zinc finger protein